MSNKLRKLIDNTKKIEIEHHYAIGSGDLDMLVEDAYHYGVDDTVDGLKRLINEFIKDDTIKTLFLDKVGQFNRRHY